MKKKIISVILTAVMAVSSVQVLGANNVKADTRDLGGFVSRLYNVCLNRSAAPEEINYWKSTVDAKGNTGISLAYEFVSSPEFQNKEMTNEDYVDYMYMALMGREADSAGKDYWAGLMNNGMSRDEVFVGFANSNEFFDICNDYGVVAGSAMVGKDPHELVGANYYTDRCYRVILGRECDRAGMEYWSNSLATNATAGATLAENFLFSNEYIAKDKSDEDFLTDLYEAMMGRAPVREELNYWISVIEAGAPDRTIFRDFVGAPEFRDICGNYGIIPGTVSENGPSSAREEEPAEKLLLASYNDEFISIADDYSDVEFDSVIYDTNVYTTYLDMVLASGEDVPDVFACDLDWGRNYICSDNTIPVAELGITGDDVSQMYRYTFQYGTDNNGSLKALAWQCCPSVVFYNRTVAQQTLGVSEPAQVAQYFWSWDAVKTTANMVHYNSNGQCKIVVGWDEMYRSAVSGATWFGADGQPVLGSTQCDFMDLAKYLTDNNLTFDAIMWSDAWNSHAMDNSVLSYWGPLWLGKFSLGFEASEWNNNPTAGNWGVVPAPQGYMWGGTFAMASKYCKDKAAAGNLLRDICCDTTNLTNMALKGEFVNNAAVMESMINNSAWNLDMLSGQNPVAYLIQSAQSAVYSSDLTNNLSGAFYDTLGAYVYGDISMNEVQEYFRDVYENGSIEYIKTVNYGFTSSNERLHDFRSRLRDEDWNYISRITTSDRYFIWQIDYANVFYATEDYLNELASSPDTFTAELYLDGEIVADNSAQSEVWWYYEDYEDYKAPASEEGSGSVNDHADPYGLVSGGLSAQIMIEPFGGCGFQLGTYELRIYDSNHTLIEVTTIIVNA